MAIIQRISHRSFRVWHPVALLILVGLVARAVHATDDDAGGGGGGGGGGFKDTVCADFRCSKGYAAVPKWPMPLHSKGCGGGMGGVSMFNMGGGLGGGDEAYEHCCHRKDACWQICGSNKQSCDREMEKCMDKACREITNDEERRKCNDSKSLTKMMMSVGGCDEFKSHQSANCECAVKSKAFEKRKRVLRNFYKKFNPEGIDKVDALAAKAAVKVATFAGLLRSLVAKYPKAIKQEKNANAEKLEKIMRDMDKASENVDSDERKWNNEDEDDSGDEDAQDLDAQGGDEF